MLKFSEIFFQEPNQKVFDVLLGTKPVISDLDIFSKLLSRGIPYDEFIPLSVKAGKVYIKVILLLLFIKLNRAKKQRTHFTTESFK